MVEISFGNETRRLESADPHWITDQVNRRRRDNLPICATVRIVLGELNLTLSTPGCGGGGGGRAPRPGGEQRIVGLWAEHHLNDVTFAPGDLVAFLKQLQRAM